MQFIKIFYFCIFFLFLTLTSAKAYIDPGIFTFLWQALVFIFISIFVFFKDILLQIKNLLIKLKQKLFVKNTKSDK